jgi:hypothetical protein
MSYGLIVWILMMVIERTNALHKRQTPNWMAVYPVKAIMFVPFFQDGDGDTVEGR